MFSPSSRKFVRSAGTLALTLFATACGGEDRGRPSGISEAEAPVDQCAKANSGLIFQPIVDFEDKRGRCNAGVSCKNPPFYFNQDEAHSVTKVGEAPAGTFGCATLDTISRPKAGWEITSPSDDENLAKDGIRDIPEGPRCADTELRSTAALHVTAANLATCYGANGRLGWGASLDLQFEPKYDAKDWEGVSFWVKRGTGRSKASLVFSVIDQYTDKAARNDSLEPCNCWHDPEDAPGTIDCPTDPSVNPNFPDSLKCDPFGGGVTLTENWTFMTVHFADLHQKGFGKPSPLGHVAAECVSPTVPDGGTCEGGLTRLQFLITPGDWDFWLDDVSFFRGSL